MRCLLITLLCLPLATLAAVFDHPVEIEHEGDLSALYEQGQLSEDAYETLLERFRDPVDLNQADRDDLAELPGLTLHDVDAILTLRAAAGHLENLEQLVAAGALTERQRRELAPFVKTKARAAPGLFSGDVELMSRVASADDVAPPVLLDGTLRGPFDLSAGGMLSLTRRVIEAPHYDGLVDSLVSRGDQLSLQAPRLFLQWFSAGKRRVVVGTFTLGFAEHLTLDTTRRSHPHGIVVVNDVRRPTALVRACRASSSEPLAGDCAEGAPERYITPDFTWREAFRGVAASVDDLPLGGTTTLSLVGFVSYQAHSLYQYELLDHRTCQGPGCAAPNVYLDQTGTARLVTTTLPFLYDELTSGGHVELRPDFRSRVGVTGYGARPFFHDAPMALDFQPWSRVPAGGAYGAVGLDGRLGVGEFDFALEATRSFDRVTGGGFGIEQRTTWSPHGQELELSLRYYDDRFKNPYARPVSAPDEFDGQRAANELGARVRSVNRFAKDWRLHARADVWVLPFTNPRLGPAGMANLYLLTRVDYDGWHLVQPALWVDLRNRNLASSQHGRCASGTVIYVEGDTSFACSGDLYRLAARVDVHPLPHRLSFALQGAFTWVDDVRYVDRFRNDLMLWAEARSTPVAWLSLRLRVRWLDQDLSDNTYLEQSVWTFVEASAQPTPWLRVGLRYDLYVWLDARASTLHREPNPEHRVMFEARAQL
jgi:hypothetical protein